MEQIEPLKYIRKTFLCDVLHFAHFKNARQLTTQWDLKIFEETA